MYNPLDLSGKTILVTGASSGIGRAIAITLAKLNARVLLTGRDEQKLAAVQAEMEASERHIPSAHTLGADEAATSTWLKDICKTIGPLNGMVHSAGVCLPVPLRIINRAHLDAIFHPNLYAALALLKAASSKYVLANDSAAILLSSASSMAGAISLSAYSASKGALNSLARSASRELAPRRIRVNCIAPGLTRTPLLDVREELPGNTENFDSKQFLGLLEPEEVAVAAAFLLSDSGRNITGTTLLMDGGFAC